LQVQRIGSPVNAFAQNQIKNSLPIITQNTSATDIGHVNYAVNLEVMMTLIAEVEHDLLDLLADEEKVDPKKFIGPVLQADGTLNLTGFDDKAYEEAKRVLNRILRTKILLASTIEGLDKNLSEWLSSNNLCVGNYVDVKLYKLGSVYQLILVYAELKG
jgi:hypothetical protein